MWKTFYYLLVLIGTLDCPHAILAQNQPILLSTEFFKRDKESTGSQPEVQGTAASHDRLVTLHKRLTGEERRNANLRAPGGFHRQPYQQEKQRATFIGRWGNNGEALEPEWRNGDSMPLFPFTPLSDSRAKDVKDDVHDETLEDDDIIEPYYHRETNDRHIDLRASSEKRQREEHVYGDEELSFRQEERDRNLMHRINNNSNNSNSNNVKTDLNISKTAAVGSWERNRDRSQGNAAKDDEHRPSTFAGYGEAFQMPSTTYEQEFNDEEYLKPRPRKRRPPQDDDFALVAAAGPSVRVVHRGDPPSATITDRQRKGSIHSERTSGNALELKSLLKMQQEEGHSLSEVLQRKNLTLHDLLKGRADIINVLKSKDIDESLEGVERASRAMADSLMKFAITESPQGTTTTLQRELKKSETRYNVNFASAPKVTKQMTFSHVESTTRSFPKETITSERNNSDDTVATGVARNGESALAADIILTATNTSWTDKRGASKNISTVSIPIPVLPISATDQTKSQTDNLEDEIMEFSDFPEFTKVKSNSVPSDWPDITNDENGTVELRRDTQATGSTLDIEHVSSPTERSIADENNGKNVMDNNQAIYLPDPTVNECNEFSQVEYLNDSPSEPEQVEGEEGEDEKEEVLRNHRNAANISVKINGGEKRMNENPRGRVNDDILLEIEPEARAEIYELFASSSSGKRLERLLKSRNMSVEELIALRQRGSSIVHLAAVSRLREQMPKYPSKESNSFNDTRLGKDDTTEKVESQITNESRTSAETVNSTEPNVERDMDSFPIETFLGTNANEDNSMSRLLTLFHPEGSTEGPHIVRPLSTTKPSKTVDLRNHNGHITRDKVNIFELLTTLEPLTFDKDAYFGSASERSDYTEFRETNRPENANAGIALPKNTDNSRQSRTHPFDFGTTGFQQSTINGVPMVESMDMERARSLPGQNNANVVGNEKKDLSKVKSSIIASGVILGMTLVVFLGIFIACRVRQKQKYTYSNTFSRAVFQGPAMAARKLSNSSTLSTVMVNVVSTSTVKKSDRKDRMEREDEIESKSDIDNDSLDADDSWETIPDYLK